MINALHSLFLKLVLRIASWRLERGYRNGTIKRGRTSQ